MASASVAPATAATVLAAPSVPSPTGASVAAAAAVTPQSPLPSISLRPLVAADLPAAHALSRAANWPHRPEDWAVNFAGGQGIAAVAAQGDAPSGSSDNEEIVGVILWWKHGAALATLGTLIVSPKLQRRGVGRRLMRAVLEDIDASALSSAANTSPPELPVPRVRLQSTAAGAALYMSLRFALTGWVVQHQGTLMPGNAPPAPALAAGCALRSLRWRDDAAAVCALDRLACGGGDRTKLLGHLAARSTGVALFSEEDGVVLGYALCRPFGHGRVIGPVVAPDDAAACALVAHLAAPLPPGFLRLDIEEEGTPLLQGWLQAAGLPRAARVPTLVRGPAAPVAKVDGVRMFALASQATS